jgi:hypothetical protein
MLSKIKIFKFSTNIAVTTECPIWKKIMNSDPSCTPPPETDCRQNTDLSIKIRCEKNLR